MYFFVHFFKSGGEGCWNMAAAVAHVRKNLFLVEYNGNKHVSEKEKKGKKMKK